ncbi:MAG: hypothetical protein KU37_06940 [Sulfuricurvum sp. PC08-66]|nr:MAG: hypothetical protein KU37_06940 [Sulfuricurvum sp. PC08-66]
MLTVGVAQMSKNPALLESGEILDIIDKKSKQAKLIAFPARYKSMLVDVIEEIEYARWLERNYEALKKGEKLDDALLLDGLDDN